MDNYIEEIANKVIDIATGSKMDDKEIIEFNERVIEVLQDNLKAFKKSIVENGEIGLRNKLFIVEKIGVYENNYFYWAKDEGEALEIHELLTGAKGGWVASQVFANNLESSNRGFVSKQDDMEAYNSGWQDGQRETLENLENIINKAKGGENE